MKVARKDPDTKQRVGRLLQQPGVTVFATVLLRLELLPKAAYNGYTEEAAFYRRWFGGVSWVDVSPAFLARTEELALKYGLSAMDAAHCTACELAGATLVTLESRSKPPHRVPWVRHLDDL